MPKLFVFSDCHGYYTELKSALDEAGYDKDNPEHWIVSVGDNIDRGREPDKVIEFLTGTKNKVLVRGNHEDLFEDLCRSKTPHSSDYHNGTVQTVFDLASDNYPEKEGEAFDIALAAYKPLLDQMVDYFETEKYVFIHSCIEPKFGWRDSTSEEWRDSRWGNPFEFWELFNIENKTAVFGHWHTSWAHCFVSEEYLSDWGSEACFDVFYGDNFIGLDGCTTYTHRVNVLVLEDEFITEEDCNGI